MRDLVLDATAFIQGVIPNTEDSQVFTTPQVLKELKGFAKVRAGELVDSGLVRVVEPGREAWRRVEGLLNKLGEGGRLTEADVSVLALTLQLSRGAEVALVSDDYGVQNVAAHLGLRSLGLATPGIKYRYTWEVYCPGCRKVFKGDSELGLCPICGTQLRRRPSGRARVGLGV